MVPAAEIVFKLFPQRSLQDSNSSVRKAACKALSQVGLQAMATGGVTIDATSVGKMIFSLHRATHSANG